MDTSPPSWFQMASRRMEWLSGRQQVIAENIANADTPGYAGQDVQPFEDFLRSQPDGTQGPELAETAPSWGANKNGNSVVLEEQTVLAAQFDRAVLLHPLVLFNGAYDSIIPTRQCARGNDNIGVNLIEAPGFDTLVLHILFQLRR